MLRLRLLPPATRPAADAPLAVRRLVSSLCYPSGLMKLISENAPKAVKEQQMENYFARKVAVDASMSLYQFLVRHTEGHSDGHSASLQR